MGQLQVRLGGISDGKEAAPHRRNTHAQGRAGPRRRGKLGTGRSPSGQEGKSGGGREEKLQGRGALGRTRRNTWHGNHHTRNIGRRRALPRRNGTLAPGLGVRLSGGERPSPWTAHAPRCHVLETECGCALQSAMRAASPYRLPQIPTPSESPVHARPKLTLMVSRAVSRRQWPFWVNSQNHG